MVRYRSVLLAVAFLVAPSGVSAVTYTWPGAAPCDTTLTACVNAVVAGSVVEIATVAPIDEDVQILGKSLTVRAAPGFKPTFAPTRFLYATHNGASAFNITFEGLTLTDGDVRVQRGGSGDSSLVVRRMRLLTSDPAAIARIRINASNAGSLVFDIAENEVHSRTDFLTEPAIEVSASGPTASGKVQFNRVTSVGNSVAAGISAVAHAGSLDVDVFGNEVRGNFGIGAIVVNNAPGAAPPAMTVRIINNVVVGYGALVGSDSRNGVRVLIGADADIFASVANNTVVATRGGLRFGRVVLGTTGTVTGTARNNLVAFNGSGLVIDAAAATVTNSYNLVFGNGSDGFIPGAGTVTSDPQLQSTWYPRLAAGSPAINAGDASYVQFLLGLNGLPQVDGDGMRRTIGSGVLGVDIGAYEFGDQSLVASKSSPTSNYFTMVHPALNSRPTVRPVLTKNFSQNGIEDPFAIGTWYTGAFWAAFNQGLETMPAGTAMNVLVPGVGGSFGASYAHVATGANTSGHVTTLDQTFLNSTADAIVLATSNWNASGAGVYNDHHIAVGSFGSWFVLNQDFADIPLDAAFNIYAQDPSPNAWVHTVAAHNRPSINRTNLDHHLLNGIACAQVHVTQRAGTLNDHPYDVDYVGGRWRVYNQDSGEMPLGSEFFVLVNPRQVFECLDVIFEDGFDA